MFYELGIGFGDVPGYSRVAIVGSLLDIDDGSEPEDVWIDGGLFPWIPSARALVAKSDNANDTAAGTGARTLSVTGLESPLSVSETTISITLNGTSASAETIPFYRINRMMVSSAGSGETNAGNIRLYDASDGTTVRNTIAAGIGIAQSCVYTPPLGYTLQIISQYVGVNRADAAGGTRYATFSNYFKVGTVRRLTLQLNASSVNPYRHDGVPGIPVNGMSDFAIRCMDVSHANTNVTAAFLGILRRNRSS